ncbi:hypothetical protein GGX14DRAFT_480046, partial [Mycena pura]
MQRLLRTTYTPCQHVDTHLRSLHLRCQRARSPCRNCGTPSSTFSRTLRRSSDRALASVARSRLAHRRTSSARSQSHTMYSTVTFTQMKPARSYGHTASAALSTRCTQPPTSFRASAVYCSRAATQNSLSRSHASSGPTCTPSPCVVSRTRGTFWNASGPCSACRLFGTRTWRSIPVATRRTFGPSSHTCLQSSGLSICRSATQARGRDHPRHSLS